jgi:hypothetical protein
VATFSQDRQSNGRAGRASAFLVAEFVAASQWVHCNYQCFLAAKRLFARFLSQNISIDIGLISAVAASRPSHAL